MTSDGQLPLWVSLVVAGLIVGGAALALIGSIGLVRLDTFYRRVHAPTLGVSLGTILILSGSIAYFSAMQGKLVLHEALIGVFVTLTTPITFMLLVRAALHRDRQEGALDVPDPNSKRLIGDEEP